MIKLEKINFAVQASSISWSGGKDICTNLINHQSVIYWTIKNILKKSKDALVTIIAPYFDKKGDFNQLKKYFDIAVYYGYNKSPLRRMIAAYKNLSDNDYIIRVDGLNFVFDVPLSLKMQKYAQKNHLDCLKFPDDFPINFTFDIYRLGALRKLAGMLKGEDVAFEMHPKYFIFTHPADFKFAYMPEIPFYSDLKLRKMRNKYRDIFAARQGDKKNRITAGDQLNFHYEIASRYVRQGDQVLDLASGEGYGTDILGKKAQKVIGADLDKKSIKQARKIHANIKNVEFARQDALHTTYPDASFDLIASMETIEHVSNDQQFMLEMKRILKRGGYFVFSTPQNCLGHIPMNNQHTREYSLEEIKKLTKKYFKIEKIIGIKQGRIVIPDDPKGTNTLLVCKKE